MKNKDNNITDPYREDVRRAAETLRHGGVILYPTDTVWGLGCDATDAEAVAKIYAIKRRSESKSMLTLMRDEAQVERYVYDPEEITFQLMREAVDPVTVIFDGAVGLAHNLIAEDGSVGIRIPKDKFCQDLLRSFPKPIVSTSANVSSDTPRKPSSIIKISKGGVFRILRK